MELSVTAAWLFRDLLGLGGLISTADVGLRSDMERLNGVLGYREIDGKPHVSKWSAKQSARITGR